MHEIEKNVVWLASYPKSGNTWCRMFLARYLDGIDNINKVAIPIYSSKNLLERYADIDISELSNKELHALRLSIFQQISHEKKTKVFPVKIHDYYEKEQYGMDFLPFSVTKAAIYIVRNPFDLTVSFARHLGKTIDQTIAILNNPDYSLAISSKRFVSQLPQKLNTWSNHYKSWTEQQDFPVLIIRYEDLYQDPVYYFSNMLTFMEIEINKEKLMDAIQFASFEQLQQQERQYGFEEKSTYAPVFFHTGKVGYSKNILNPNQINTIFENHFELIHQLGYEHLI